MPKGYDKALEWFQTAVDNNDNVNAVYYIGNIYYKGGYGIKMNYKRALSCYKRALSCYKRAASNDHAIAQNKIGRMFVLGLDVNKRDYIQAMD